MATSTRQASGQSHSEREAAYVTAEAATYQEFRVATQALASLRDDLDLHNAHFFSEAADLICFDKSKNGKGVRKPVFGTSNAVLRL